MTKKAKIITSIVCIFLVTIIAATGFLIWKSNRIPTKIVYTPAADRDVNLDDPREVVGVSSYVFVGKVEETYDYYSQKTKRQFPEIVDYFGGEFTECRVKIVADIKGNLTIGNVFSYYKVGGINKSRTCIVLEEGDILPENSKYYIFTGGAHADGTMTGGMTIPLESNINEDNLDESKIYQQYLDAFDSQILPKNKGTYPDYLCTADKDYRDGSYNAKLYSDYLKNKEESDKKYAEENSMNYEEFHKKHFDYEYDNAVKKGNPKIE